MVKKLFNWMSIHNTAITWFIIGMLFNNMLIHLGRGQLDLAALDVIIAGVNYYFWKTSNVR